MKQDDGSKQTRWTRSPQQYGADVDLSDIIRTKRVDSKIPPRSTSEHLFKSGNTHTSPDLLSQLVDNLFTEPSHSHDQSTFPKISAFSRGGNGTQQVPVPRGPHPYIFATHADSKAGRTKQAAPGLDPYSLSLPEGVGAEAIDLMFQYPFSNVQAERKRLLLQQKQLDATRGQKYQQARIGQGLDPFGDEKNPDVSVQDPLAAEMARIRQQAGIGPSGTPTGGSVIVESIIRQKAMESLKQQGAPQSPVQAPPAPSVGPKSPPMAPMTPKPAAPPSGLPTSVQNVLPKPAPAPTMAPPAPKPAPKPPGAARAAVQTQLDSGVPAGQAKQTATAAEAGPVPTSAGSTEDKPFQLPPNLSGVQMPSKEENAQALNAFQAKSVAAGPEKTQYQGPDHPAPPPEARPGDPAYTPGGSAQPQPQEQPTVGRFYGAIQRAQALNANRKAYLERRLAARYGVGQSERVSAQQELARINAGGDNNIVQGLKQDQQLGAEDYLSKGFSPATVAGWQGNNTARDGKTVSTRAYWEQDAANTLAQEKGMPAQPNQYATYLGPKAKGLQGVATTQPVMGQGAGGVSMAQGRPTPLSPVRNMNAATKPQVAGGIDLSAPKGMAGNIPPKPPKPGIGSPLGVPGGKAAAYIEKEANGWTNAYKFITGTGARYARPNMGVVNNSTWGKGNGLWGMAQRALFQPATAQNTKGGPLWSNMKRWYNAPAWQPVWGGMTGSAMGAGVDSMAGLAGYDTDGWGATLGGGAGMMSRIPGVRGVMNLYGNRALGSNANLGTKAKNLFTWGHGAQPGTLGSLTGWGPGATSKIQGALLTGGIGADVVGGMAKRRGEEAAMNAANGLAQRFGFSGVEGLYNSPVGQGLVGWNRGGALGAASGAWGALSPQQRMALGLGVGTMGAGLGTMAFTDQDAAGLGMMGLGALGTAHGLGAFSGMGQQSDVRESVRNQMSRNEMAHAQG
jgi:hypothetical protein